MKLKKVWLMSGIPGSGKSTWAKNQLNKSVSVWCSRDAVRFSMLDENDTYFDKENEVFNTWISQICDALNNPEVEDIYIDATHISNKSRFKTLRKLPKENIEKITNVVFTTPLEICLERNAKRTGRERVPDEVIRGMSSCCEHPERYNTIYVNERGETFE